MDLHRKFARVPIRFAFSRMQASIEMLHREQLRGDHKEEEKRKREKDVRAGFLFSKSIRCIPSHYIPDKPEVKLNPNNLS